jgi:ABC-type nitrate/sulfonate/bicarbonate transport system permease component
LVLLSPDKLSASAVSTQSVSTLVLADEEMDETLRHMIPPLRAGLPNLRVVVMMSAAPSQHGEAEKSVSEACRHFLRNHVDEVYWLPAEPGPERAAVLATFCHSAAEGEANGRPGLFAIAAHKLGNVLAVGLVLLSLWWAGVALFAPASYLLPGPAAVSAAFSQNAEAFLAHAVVTAAEAALGFAIGNVFGIFVAILLHRFVQLQSFTLPVLISFQAVPVVALAPLLVVWLGSGLASKVAMACIICFFPIVVNALQAFATVSREYIELLAFYRATFFWQLRMLLFPASFHAIIAAMKISAGLSVVGAIVAELTGADQGLGYVLLNASYRLETDTLFVAILLSAGLGVAFFQLPDLLRLIVPRSWRMALS